MLAWPAHEQALLETTMHVRVVSHDPLWAALYEDEARRIRGVLLGILVDIHHIGSTSVKGLLAKPIIDIMPVVTRIDLVDARNPRFEDLGYECVGENGIPGRRYLRKGGDDRTHQVHVFGQGDRHNVERHLAVRDYLRRHPDVAADYGRLKSEIAIRFPEDIEGYAKAKDAFVKAMEREALRWYRGAERG